MVSRNLERANEIDGFKNSALEYGIKNNCYNHHDNYGRIKNMTLYAKLASVYSIILSIRYYFCVQQIFSVGGSQHKKKKQYTKSMCTLFI